MKKCRIIEDITNIVEIISHTTDQTDGDRVIGEVPLEKLLILDSQNGINRIGIVTGEKDLWVGITDLLIDGEVVIQDRVVTRQ